MRLNDSSSFAFAGVATSLSAGNTDYYQANMIFAMATAPVGWVKQTANNDYAFRIVGTGVPNSGGSSNFSTVYTPVTTSGTVPAPVSANVMPILGTVTVGGVALTAAQLPPHTHPYCGIQTQGPFNFSRPSPQTFFGVAVGSCTSTASFGSCAPTPHTHATTGLTTAALGSFTGASTVLGINYIDNIIAQYQK
jgi:hypothetical protein